MQTPERFQSPVKSFSLRKRNMRLRSIDHLNLNKTTPLNVKEGSDTNLKPDLTEFVFDENKKKNEIGRIIDDYFDGSLHFANPKQPKSFSLMGFTKLDNVSRKRTSIKAKLSLPMDIGDIGDISSFQTTMLPPKDSNLPPIFEQEPETPSKFNALLMKMIRRTPIPSLSRKSSKNKRVQAKKIQINNRFTLAEGKQVTKTFTSEGMSLLYLQLRAYHIIKEFDVQSMYNYQRGNTLHYKMFSPFRKLLYNISEEQINSQMSFLITPLPLYEQLFNNNCELFLHLIKSLLIVITKIKGRLINNNINLSNIHYCKQNLIIDSWATSSIQQPKIGRVVHPALRNKEQWFVALQYLPPEMLQSIISDTYYNMFQHPSSIDIWSIGSLILEVMTLIPLFATQKFILNHNSKVMRRGIYSGKINDVESLIKRQKKLCSRLKSHLDKLGEVPKNLNPKIMDLMTKMLKVNPEQRLTPEEGLKIIG